MDFCFCLFASSILECIMQIPFHKNTSQHTGVKMVVEDMKEGIQFITKKQPVLCKLLVVLAGLNLVLSSLITVGLPVISNVILGLDATYYGWLQASIGIGTIIGSICIPLFDKRFTIKSSYFFLLVASICLFPVVIALLFAQNVYLSYALVLLGSVLTMVFATIFNIYAQTYMQQITPKDLLGKVSSLVMMIVMCSYPIGQAAYGFLFDILANEAYLIIFFAIVISIGISLLTKKYTKQM